MSCGLSLSGGFFPIELEKGFKEFGAVLMSSLGEFEISDKDGSAEIAAKTTGGALG